MKHPRYLKALGLVALTVGSPPAANAQLQSYYHAGAWDAFSGRNNKGGAVCGVGNTNVAYNRRLSIRFEIGGSDSVFSASKPDWSIPDNTPIRVVMQVGLGTPWTQQATGHGHSIDWLIDRTAMQAFDQQFRGAPSMTLTFPDGNEPSWTISLAGSSAISDAFDRCVRDLTRRVQGSQPANNGPPPGAAGVATQPFSPSAGAQRPDGALGGSPPDATEPNATQPAH